MAEEALARADRQLVGESTEDALDRTPLGRIVSRGARAVRVDVVNGLRRKTRIRQCSRQGARHPRAGGIGRGVVEGIGRQAISHELGQRRSSACLCTTRGLEKHEGRALAKRGSHRRAEWGAGSFG